MALKIQGTEVVDDDRNITNGATANVVSLSINGSEILASAAELNVLVGANTSVTFQNQIDNFDFADATLIKTFTTNETADIQLSANTFVSPVVGAVKDVGGTLTGAVLGTDYTYTFINNDTVRFKSLIAADFQIRIA